jgi:hypothetical protein
MLLRASYELKEKQLREENDRLQAELQTAKANEGEQNVILHCLLFCFGSQSNDQDRL